MEQRSPKNTKDQRSLREKATSVVQKLQAAGHEAYFAGGCVRDALLGIQPKDYDIATSATPETVQGLFRKTIPIGIQFGVIQVRYGGEGFEVATFRTDGGYTDGRRPDSIVFSTAQADVERRDFTMNGLLFDPIEDRLLDFVDGEKDLRKGLIRAIGTPHERIKEDRLRMLRAVRFAARFQFEVEPDTMAALASFATSITQVSMERVREELFRIFREGGAAQGIELLDHSGLLDALFGAIWVESPGPRSVLLRVCTDLQSRSPMSFLTTLLFGQSTRELEAFSRNLKLSNAERKRLVEMGELMSAFHALEKQDVASVKRLVRSEAWNDLHPVLVSLQKHQVLDDAPSASSLIARSEQWSHDDLWPSPLLNGQDLKTLGLPPGPHYKQILGELETRQLEGSCTTREEAIALVKELDNG